MLTVSSPNTLLQVDTVRPAGTPVEFIPNVEFDSLSEDELRQIPAGTSLYSDRDDEAQIEPTEVGDLQMLHSLPLLSAAGECFLFRKLNYLKSLAEQARQKLDRRTLATDQINGFENLLADADAVRNHLAECNMRLVIWIARKFATNHAEFDELVSEGSMILLRAIDKFDYSRGFRFSTYVTHSVQRHFFRFSNQRKRRIQMELGSSSELLNGAPAVEDDSVDHEAVMEEERRVARLVARMDECLDEREQVIVRRRFGIDSVGVVRTLRDVASELGLSKERVRQIQVVAVDKLRDFFGELGAGALDTSA